MNRRDFLRATAVSALALPGCGGFNSSQTQSVVEGDTSRAPGGRAGVQAILLPHWNLASRNNFMSVSFPGKTAISFGPFLLNPTNSFANITTILDNLISRGIEVSVTMFLGTEPHLAGSSGDSAINSAFANRGFTDFIARYSGRAILSVSPSLEDVGSSQDVNRWARLIEQKAGNNAGVLGFRRSPNNANDTYLPAQGRLRTVQLEKHGGVTSSTLAGSAYSNDGNFVGDLAKETANGNQPQYSLAGLAGEVRRLNFTGTVLLWRPTYNLRPYRDANGVRSFDLNGRDWSENAFDSREVDFLNRFFRS